MTMSEELTALHVSATRLHRIVGGFGPEQVRQSAYPSEWSVADVLSHLGSGAVIMRRNFEDALAGNEADGSFNQSVWDGWNAKTPEDQAAEALVADAALLAALDDSSEEQRRGFSFTVGPMTLDFDHFVGLRLNEHVVHTWDVEVVVDPAAVLPDEAAPVIIDGVGVIAGLVGRPTGTDTTVQVSTTGPERHLAVVLTADSVQLVTSPPGSDPDLTLATEAFIRLVYGRLDPDHAPPGIEGPSLDLLRQVFPGF
jgi:uncharacterized protein (TIGR03083 family)